MESNSVCNHTRSDDRVAGIRCLITSMINNGNGTEWSPVRSVIIRVINKIERPRRGSLIFIITSMIIDRTGRQEVLLPINHNSNKM